METSAPAASREVAEVRGTTGFLTVVRGAAREVFGYLFTAKFWVSVLKKVGAAAGEAIAAECILKLKESRSRIRGALGVDPNDPALGGAAAAAQAPVAGMTQPYNPAPQTAARPGYDPTPSWQPGYRPYTPPAAPPHPAEWPGMLR